MEISKVTRMKEAQFYIFQRDTELRNGESRSSSLQQADKEEICSDSAADVQRDFPLFDNDNNDSGSCKASNHT